MLFVFKKKMIFIREAHPSPNLCQIQYTPGANKWFIEARNIYDGIIPKAKRWVLHAFPLLEAAISRKAWCRFSFREEE
jgi:hypothetical protein